MSIPYDDFPGGIGMTMGNWLAVIALIEEANPELAAVLTPYVNDDPALAATYCEISLDAEAIAAIHAAAS